MDNGFSGTVRISAVDDFISLSQDCIKPLTEIVKVRQARQRAQGEGTSVAVQNEPQLEQAPDAPTQAVHITLNDCLACSGCVTTAEAVLIEQQSYVQVAKALAFEDKHVVVTVSTQSLASLAVRYSVSLQQAFAAVLKFFSNIGVSCVLPLSFVRAFSLLASEREFIHKFKRAQQNPEHRSTHLPVYSAACPGWVCFAEKTHGDLLLPHMSNARSPQAVAGGLVKRCLAQTKGWRASNIYHVSVMPCFDKKLEAARSQLIFESAPETDCVISSGELHNWMCDVLEDVDAFMRNSHKPQLHLLWPAAESLSSALQHHGGGGSGGYAHHVLTRAAQELFGVNHPEIVVNRINKDFDELLLAEPSDSSKPPLLRFARAYGFRNIQNIVLKCKRNKMIFDYIEVMACPSGCVNGGGQLRPENVKDRQSVLDAVTSLYNSEQEYQPVTEDCVPAELLAALNAELENQWDEAEGNTKVNAQFLTDYNALESSATSMIKW